MPDWTFVSHCFSKDTLTWNIRPYLRLLPFVIFFARKITEGTREGMWIDGNTDGGQKTHASSEKDLTIIIITSRRYQRALRIRVASKSENSPAHCVPIGYTDRYFHTEKHPPTNHVNAPSPRTEAPGMNTCLGSSCFFTRPTSFLASSMGCTSTVHARVYVHNEPTTRVKGVRGGGGYPPSVRE